MTGFESAAFPATIYATATRAISFNILDKNTSFSPATLQYEKLLTQHQRIDLLFVSGMTDHFIKQKNCVMFPLNQHTHHHVAKFECLNFLIAM